MSPNMMKKNRGPVQTQLVFHGNLKFSRNDDEKELQSELKDSKVQNKREKITEISI